MENNSSIYSPNSEDSQKTLSLSTIEDDETDMNINGVIAISNTSEAATSNGLSRAASVESSPEEVPVVGSAISRTKKIFERDMEKLIVNIISIVSFPVVNEKPLKKSYKRAFGFVFQCHSILDNYFAGLGLCSDDNGVVLDGNK